MGLSRFDLAIVPEHDRVKENSHVVSTLLTPTIIDAQYAQARAADFQKRFHLSDVSGHYGGPNIALLIGGDTPDFSLSPEQIETINTQLKATVSSLKGQLFVTTSRRTDPEIDRLCEQDYANYFACALLVIANKKNIPDTVAAMVGLSDIVVVSGESISMVSEAVSAEKYVLVFMPQKKVKALTKQERFLQRLAEVGLIKLVEVQSLGEELQGLWKSQPEKPKIPDRQRIEQALRMLV